MADLQSEIMTPNMNTGVKVAVIEETRQVRELNKVISFASRFSKGLENKTFAYLNQLFKSALVSR